MGVSFSGAEPSTSTGHRVTAPLPATGSGLQSHAGEASHRCAVAVDDERFWSLVLESLAAYD
jgi:hypothetical protein